MNGSKSAACLCVCAILLGPGVLLAASAQVELTIVDEQGRSVQEGLIMFARVDDPTQTFTILQNDAGAYADSVTVPEGESAWRVTRVVASGYLPTKIGVRSAAGDRVAQELSDVELGLATPIPEITILAGGAVRIDLTLGERKAVLERHRAQAQAEADTAAAEAAATPAIDAEYAEGLRLYQAGDLKGALPHLAQAARANPDQVEIQVTYANLLYKAKRYDEFEPAARAALALQPDNRELWMMLYSSARNRGDLRAARDALLEVERHGGGPDLAQHLDFVARKLGSSADAVPAWEALLRLDPKNADACVALASLYSDRGDRKRSDEYLARAVQLAPSRASELYLDLGSRLVAAKSAGPAEFDRAIELFRKSIELSPGLAAAHKKLGLALWKKEDLDGARAELQTYLELSPDAEDADQIRDYLARLSE